MSEIKFRAWDNESKKMFRVVSLSDSIYGECEVPHLRVCELDKCPSNKSTQIYTIYDYELLQCTDFKDEVGKEICEGDILERELYWSIRIEYSKGCLMVRDLDAVRHTNLILNAPINTFDFSRWRIIGNIYENPGLLNN